MVREQACSCYHKLDQSLSQTLNTFDLIHSSHMWIQTILSCGKYSTTKQIRIVSGFWFRRRSWRLKINIRCTFAHFRKSHVRATSWMFKKRTSVSHSSTEADIISLDAGLRMDGVPALDLWDLVIEVFHDSPNQLNNTKGQVQGKLSRDTTSNWHTQNKTKFPTQHDNFDLNNVDCVPSNANYIFEENEAMIKMIIKGRSITMRHVSRTHRVALDWLFDRINLDPTNQIKYVDTKRQLADILTKGNFTRDEWNNLLHLFNISHFSSLCCAQNFSLTSCTKTRAKRMQEQEGNNRWQSQSRRRRTDWSSTGKPDANDRNLDAASSSQGWQKDAFLDLCTGKLVAPGCPWNPGTRAIQRKDHLHVNAQWKLIGQNEEKIYIVLRMLSKLQIMLEDSRKDIGRFWCLDPKKWHGTHANKPDGEWDKTAEGMMHNFAESGRPVFRASSDLERGELKSKGKGVKSVHFNGSDETIELILRTVISVNELSVHRAVPDLCKELPRDSSGAGKPAANENLESMVTPPEFPTGSPISQTDAEVQRKLLRAYERKFAELPEQQKLTKLCSNAGFSKNIDKGHFFITLDEEWHDDMKRSCREYTLPRKEETSRVRGGIRGNTKIGPVLDGKVCYHQGRCSVEIMIESLFRDRTVSWVRIVNGINK